MCCALQSWHGWDSCRNTGCVLLLLLLGTCSSNKDKGNVGQCRQNNVHSTACLQCRDLTMQHATYFARSSMRLKLAAPPQGVATLTLKARKSSARR